MSKKKERTAIVHECIFKHEVDQGQSFSMVEMDNVYRVHCNVCGAFGPYAETEEEAVKLWNRREIIVVDAEGWKKLTGSEECPI